MSKIVEEITGIKLTWFQRELLKRLERGEELVIFKPRQSLCTQTAKIIKATIPQPPAKEEEQ